MASKRIQGITIEIAGDATKLNNSLKSVDKQLSQTQASLRDIDKLMAFDKSKLGAGNVELLTQKQKYLTSEIALTKDRLHELEAAQGQVARGSKEWDDLQREIIATKQNLQSLEDEYKEFGSVSAQQVKIVGEKMQSVGGKIEGVGRQLAGVSAAAAGALGAMGKLGYDAVKSADDLNTLSKQTGVSTEQLQKWSYAADLVDVDVDTITGAMRKMKKNLDSNSEAFAALGVETMDSSGNLRDSTDIFYDTLAALSQIDNETERDISAMDIFGKSADELAGVIDDGGEALKVYGQEAEDLGLILGGETLDNLNEINDTIDKTKATLSASFGAAGATIAETFAPALDSMVEAVNKFAEAVRNLTPEQVQMITATLAVVAALSPVLIIVGKLTSAVGGLLTAAPQIVSALGAFASPIAAAVVAIGSLVAAFAYLYTINEDFRTSMNTTAATLKETFLKSMEEAKPAIEGLKQAFQSFMNFIEPILSYIMTAWAATVNGIVSALPPIINAISSAINTLVNIWQAFAALFRGDFDGFKEHINTAVSSGIEFAKSIITAGLNYIKGFFSAFGVDIVGSIKSAFTRMADTVRSKTNEVKTNITNGLNAAADFVRSLPSKFYQWGADMIQNLINGISQKIGVLKQKVSDVANTIRSYIHFSEPDVGPLSDASEYMPDFINMLVKGLDQGIPKVESAADRLASAMAMGGNNSQTFNAGGVTVNVYATEGQQANDIVDVIEQRINRNITQQQAVWGMA